MLAFLVLSLIFMCLQKTTTSSLPKPCRAWLDSCRDGLYVCTTEEQFLIDSARCQNDSANPVPSPPEECMLVNGSCLFTSNVPTCATWQVDCTSEYACGTLQQYESTLSCPYLLGAPPPPEEMCMPLEERCNWFQPCRSWQNYCNGEYVCGTLSEYWTFMNSPHPACTLTSANIFRIPPGKCIVQDGHCAWSNCMAWMNVCHTSWLCGTEHDNNLYQVLPPPPCPPIDAAHLWPEQPGICSYSSTLRQCQFIQDPCVNVSCAVGYRCNIYQPTHEAYCEPSCTIDNGGCPDGFNCRIEDVSCEVPPCVLNIICTQNLSEPLCMGGKEFTECGSACPATCENRRSDMVCPQMCVPGCFCPPGTVDNNGTCIDPMHCSDTQDPPSECTNGKEFSSCGSACPPTCDSNDIICTFSCVSGCFCPAGMVEHNGTCIDPLLCPSVQGSHCLGGKVYTDCGTACPITCENNGSDFACPLICVSGCFCPAGTVDYNGTCIDPLHCPNAQISQCSHGKMYSDCGSPCPATCENNGRGLACLAMCVPGCFCPAGTVDYNGTCIDPLHCTDANAVDTVSSRQEEFLITGFVVTVLSTLLLSVVGVVLVLRRKLSRRGQYAAVILVNEESAKDSIEVKDRKASKHISVSQIASNGLLGTGLGINAERMVAV